MIRLVRSELLRARSRRLVWLLPLLAVGGMVIGIVIGAVNSHPPSAGELAGAQQAYEQQLDRCLRGRFVPEDQLPPEYPDLEAFCRDQVRPEYYESGQGLRLSGLNGLIQGLATLTVVVGMVIAASLIGADWSAGTMATLLTWEPRRVAVFAVRAVVVAVVVFVVAVVLLALFAVLFWAAVALRGTSAGSDAWLGEVAGSVLRIGFVAALFGLFVFALSSIGRSTAAGLGIMLGEVVLVEGFLRGFRPSLERWLALSNAVIVVSGERQVDFGANTASPAGAALTLGAYVAAGLVIAALAFRARDVS